MTGTESTDLIETRQATYHFLRSALFAPTPEQHEWMRQPGFATALGELAAAFGVVLPEVEWVPEHWPDHASRYLACFEVGLPTPPVPLLASHYQNQEPVPRVIHEHILFYRRFGLQPPSVSQEPADHLLHQLAFLIHLDSLLLAGGLDAESILWARHDFLTRQTRWLAAATQQTEEKHLPPIYRVLLAVLTAALAEDLALCRSAREQRVLEVS